MENFTARHGATRITVHEGALRGQAEDGSTFTARSPLGLAVAEPTTAALVEALTPPASWGVLLVRKGGFAVARLAREQLVEHKIGQRHVQGRTKAGGQSQQRFARRRDNQAREAYRAAAGHAERILTGLDGPLVTGGDEAALAEVLASRPLAGLDLRPTPLPVPDPRRAVVDDVVARSAQTWVEVTNAGS